MTTGWGGGCECCCRLFAAALCDWTGDYGDWTVFNNSLFTTVDGAELVSNPLLPADVALVIGFGQDFVGAANESVVKFAQQDDDNYWQVNVAAGDFVAFNSTTNRVRNGIKVREVIGGSATLKARYASGEDANDEVAVAAAIVGEGLFIAPASGDSTNGVQLIRLANSFTGAGTLTISNSGSGTSAFLIDGVVARDDDNGDVFAKTGVPSTFLTANDSGLPNCFKLEQDTIDTPCVNAHAPLLQLTVGAASPGTHPGTGTFDLYRVANGAPSNGAMFCSDTNPDHWSLHLGYDGTNAFFIVLDDAGDTFFRRNASLGNVDCTALSGYTLAPVLSGASTDSASLTSA